ncbi:hypothetical protein [Hydrogenophaga sp.]|uniref:hypothetical protein n=1 Tax=Hydrogenophaga sp. TaxID=1904254 RepID=UPI00260B9997|nr:hypothetical protein [Hydrogenophaga sp.]MCW5655591.1 hypothetical protein [Hydrogenophaga sp.]
MKKVMMLKSALRCHRARAALRAVAKLLLVAVVGGSGMGGHGSAWAQPPSVEISSRLVPGVDIVTETVNEGWSAWSPFALSLSKGLHRLSA